MFGLYEDYDYTFEITAYGDTEMKEFIDKFKNFNERHPFYISYSGFAPSHFYMDPTCRVIFLKHRDNLKNTTAGLKAYLQEIITSCGIDKSVHLLNS